MTAFPISPAAQASKMRAAIRAAGIDTKGLVRVRRREFGTSIEIFAPASLYGEIEDALNAVEHDLFWPIDW